MSIEKDAITASEWIFLLSRLLPVFLALLPAPLFNQFIAPLSRTTIALTTTLMCFGSLAFCNIANRLMSSILTARPAENKCFREALSVADELENDGAGQE